MSPSPTLSRSRPSPSTAEGLNAELPQLVLDSRRALTHIRTLLTQRMVNIQGLNVFGWGQWLNEPYRIEDQWGRYGSSAGVQILGMTHGRFGDGRWAEACTALGIAVDELFPARVPATTSRQTQSHEPTRNDPDPWKHRDFAQPMKVAFCVDALAPDIAKAVQGELPGLVTHLIKQRLTHEACWSTRRATDRHSAHHDRVLVSALALFALRRFPDVHRQERVAAAYRWLADHANDDLGVDVRALCGLALHGACGQVRQEQAVKRAVRDCDRRLLGWADANQQPILERPWFNPYVDEDNIDYVFLSPEIVIALYFARREMDGSAEAYVHKVVRALADNINGPDGDQSARGLRVQSALEGTVDQLWATRLLIAFLEIAEPRLDADEERRTLPDQPRGGIWRRAFAEWRVRVVAVAATCAVFAAAISAAASKSSPIVIGVSALVTFFVAKVLNPIFDPVFADLVRQWTSRRGGRRH